jgi:hypothetical protein
MNQLIHLLNMNQGHGCAQLAEYFHASLPPSLAGLRLPGSFGWPCVLVRAHAANHQRRQGYKNRVSINELVYFGEKPRKTCMSWHVAVFFSGILLICGICQPHIQSHSLLLLEPTLCSADTNKKLDVTTYEA